MFMSVRKDEEKVSLVNDKIASLNDLIVET